MAVTTILESSKSEFFSKNPLMDFHTYEAFLGKRQSWCLIDMLYVKFAYIIFSHSQERWCVRHVTGHYSVSLQSLTAHHVVVSDVRDVLSIRYTTVVELPGHMTTVDRCAAVTLVSSHVSNYCYLMIGVWITLLQRWDSCQMWCSMNKVDHHAAETTVLEYVFQFPCLWRIQPYRRMPYRHWSHVMKTYEQWL